MNSIPTLSSSIGGNERNVDCRLQERKLSNNSGHTTKNLKVTSIDLFRQSSGQLYYLQRRRILAQVICQMFRRAENKNQNAFKIKVSQITAIFEAVFIFLVITKTLQVFTNVFPIILRTYQLC